ncbi:class I SAM-dependent methyltransferase [Mesonia sp.]|uniref:class I SAM-dependent methyltransferase n=2 Tax=Mesonia sp. TaxID=1960830 RepID=UPI003F9B6F8D
MIVPDIFGQAVIDHFEKQNAEKNHESLRQPTRYELENTPQNLQSKSRKIKPSGGIKVIATDFDDDEIPTEYLFRKFKEMPKLEQKALQLAKGKTLDVGCCAGSHALVLQEKGIEIKAIDVSQGAIKVARLRGIKNAVVQDFFEEQEKFDTILMLMNGIGIVGKLRKLTAFFEHLKSILNPNGKVLLDSSDLHYLFDKEEDGSIWVDPTQYYGELRYQIQYKEEISAPFDWLYLDFNSLQLAAESNGFSCKLVEEGEHYDYLAQLQLN